MNILIVGANFINKGAQSMLFTLINEIKLRDASAEVFFASQEYLDLENYNFQHLLFTPENKEVLLNSKNKKIKYKRLFKDIIKVLLKRISFKDLKNDWKSYKEVKQILPQIDLVLDISGYNLGEKWSDFVQEEYLKNIKIAQKYDIPMILFPQSFGPFDYSEERSWLLKEIEENLPYCEKIYVREETGLLDLKNMGLQNIEWSPDLVLQSNKIDTKRIISKDLKIKHFEISKNSVAIVPNAQCFRFGNSKDILNLYKEIIIEVLKKNDFVYLIRHSKDDLEACKIIKNLFAEDSKVILLSDDINCMEYEELINSFNFIICSRYHGIVHAYRQAIPTILLGWEEKYKALADLMNQSQYNFDIVNQEIENSLITEAVNDMNKKYEDNSLIIRNSLNKIKEYNCFKVLDQYITKFK